MPESSPAASAADLQTLFESAVTGRVGVRLTFLKKDRADTARKRLQPSYVLTWPGVSTDLVYLFDMADADRLKAIVEDMQDDSDKTAFVYFDVVAPDADYELDADDADYLAKHETFGDDVEVAEFEAAFIADDGPVATKEPVNFTLLNDAEVHGDIFSNPILNTKMTVFFAARRDEKVFKGSPEVKFSDFLISNLSKVRVGKKDGACFVPGVLMEGRRLNNAVTKLHMMGLDVDSGPDMEGVIAKLRAMGLFFIAYTTHSHGTTTIEVKKDRYYKWAGDNGHATEPTTATVKLFLTDEGKYTADVIASAEYVETVHEVTGVQHIVRTRPIDKFRIVFPLETPYVIADQPSSQKGAITAWGEMILGMGAMLGISVDRAARDCSRLFYLPSKAPGATNARVIIQDGKPLDWTKIKKVSVKDYGKATSDPFDRAGSSMGGNGKRRPESPGGINLMSWAGERAHGFLISSVFKDYCAEHLKEETAPGKHTVTCPFDDEHSNAGDPDDKGCFICDAGMDNESFAFRCSHDSCAGRDRLDMLQKAMEDGWFTDDVLTDPAYDVAGEDAPVGEGQESEVADDDDAADPDAAVTRLLSLNGLIKKADAEKQCDGFVSEPTLEALMNCVARQKSRVPIYERIKKTLRIAITDFKKEVESRAKDHAKAAASEKRKKAAKAGEAATIYSGDDFPVQWGALLSGLRRLNDPPYMFLHGGDMKRLPGEAEQHSVAGFLKHMSFTDFKTECNSAVTFVAESEHGDRVASLADDIPAHVWGMRDKPVPVADRFTRVPVFGPDGTLRTEDGYDEATRTILQTSGLNLDPVPSVPTDADVATAKHWLLDMALADFPVVDDFGGSEGGDGSSSLAHIVAMLVQQFARELYTGPTPFFFIDKPQPGTGASLLVELLYQIVVGRPASPQVLGKNEDEIRKGITTKLSSGSPIIFYDNVRNKIHGEALAILGTADWWEDRILGRTENYVGPNRALTVFTGNNMTMADEMVRRMLPIRLDAKMSDPENRANFVVSDLRNWIVESRGKLVWSCLVLVRNWIAKGMKRSTAHLASYEDFAAVMGGILEAAGIGGFLENLDAFRASAKIEATDESGYMQAIVDSQPVESAFSTDDAHGVIYDPYGRLLFPALNINEDDPAAQKRILGMRLRNHVGRRFKLTVKGVETEVRFERAPMKDHTARWRFTVPPAP